MTRKRTRAETEAERILKVAAERRQAFDAVSLQPDASTLPRQADVQVDRAQRATDANRASIERARRMDAFEALKLSLARHPGAYDAARRLERDWITRFGLHDRGQTYVVVDGEGRDRTEVMVEAGKRVDLVTGQIGDRNAWLLHSLIFPDPEIATWRGIVERITGETTEHGQSAAVRQACVNLALAYQRLERRAA